MAGSEVYTYNKCIELSKHHNVSVFTRIENEFQKPYEITESIERGLTVIRVNKPGRDYIFRNKYIDSHIAEIFQKKLKEIKPDVVHINHLSHLTVRIVDIINEFQIPILFTLHDFWMMCIRGQLIHDDLTLCSGPNIQKCAKCNKKYFLSELNASKEIERWLRSLSRVNKKVDLFIAPSKYLREFYLNYGIPEQKIVYMDYGFNKELFNGFQKVPSDKIRFGFLGRIVPVKGVSVLIDTFNRVDHTKAELQIYGAQPKSSIFLKNKFANSAIKFTGSFDNKDIAKILSNIDVLVVPSLWYENSPLVIHEAFLARIPVITSNLGGMTELISHKKNGLLFNPGDVDDLERCINMFINSPELIKRYSLKTYVRSIEEDVREIEKLYYMLLKSLEEEILAR